MSPSQFDPQQFPRNSKHELELEFEAQGHRLTMPVLLARGELDGPTLVVSAGVHGDEFEGVRTIFDVYRGLDAVSMAGDFLAVPVVNGPAFWNCSRTSPLDGGNLARVFPGRPDGSPTEVIAWHFDQRILARADFYLDLHSAGVACAMPALVGYAADDPRSRAAAFAFGAPVVWGHPTIPPGRTVSAARARGIPFLYTEARGAGRIHPDDLSLYTRGVWNLLKHLEIVAGDAEPAPCRYHLFGDGNIDESLNATQPGFLVSEVTLLARVERGQLLGSLLDLRGRVLEQYHAPSSGRVVLIHECPRVTAGEPLFLVTQEAGQRSGN
jgi:predicted deacylase